MVKKTHIFEFRNLATRKIQFYFSNPKISTKFVLANSN
jgi:hypothetical protein